MWALRFSRRLNDWEVFDVECFLLRLQGRRVCSDVEDQVVWTKAKDRRFSIKSLYKALESERLGDFPSRVIWNSLVPPRVSFFAWEATWKKVLTLDRIHRMGSLWLIDVICACQRNSLLITSSCIVWWQEVYGAYFFPSLGFRGRSLFQLERRYWGGLGLVWEKGGRKCGFQLACAFFRLFGRKETVGLLKTRSIRFMGVNCFSFVIFGCGLRGFLALASFSL